MGLRMLQGQKEAMTVAAKEKYLQSLAARTEIKRDEKSGRIIDRIRHEGEMGSLIDTLNKRKGIDQNLTEGTMRLGQKAKERIKDKAFQYSLLGKTVRSAIPSVTIRKEIPYEYKRPSLLDKTFNTIYNKARPAMQRFSNKQRRDYVREKLEDIKHHPRTQYLQDYSNTLLREKRRRLKEELERKIRGL